MEVSMKPLHIAALVKQVPNVENLQLGPGGRLQRGEGVELSMNPYCLRAVSKGIELAKETGGRCTVISMGPPAAEDVVRWGVAMGAERGILISDPAFAGSDTLATAHVLAEVIRQYGPYDLIFVGKNAVDADTGQVGPQLAELLGYPFASAVRTLTYCPSGRVHVGCEHDDAWLEAEMTLPAVLSAAERLCGAGKVTREEKAMVPADKVRVVTAADLTDIPRGQAGSPTWVGETKVLDVKRDRHILQGSLAAQVEQAIGILIERQALAETTGAVMGSIGEPIPWPTTALLVLMEPQRPGSARELLGAGSELARQMHGSVTALQVAASDEPSAEALCTWGADHLCVLHHVTTQCDYCRRDLHRAARNPKSSD
jgi:electron transfer flavoprotein alpha/beta subunit